MKDRKQSSFVAFIYAASTQIGKITDKRLPTELMPKQIPRTEIQAMDESYIHPDEQAPDTWEWINKEILNQLQQEIFTLEKEYDDQEAVYLRKVFACESREERELLETKYFKSRQTAKDMINRKKRDLAQKIDQALINERYVRRR